MSIADEPLFVAVGDSFTEGVADGPDGADRFRGWADRAALALARTAPATLPSTGPALRYANLAVRGKLLDEVAADQLTRALGMAPTLLSFHAGGNDVLRPGADVPDLVRRYELAARRAVDGAPTVLLFTVIERVGEGGATADRLATRIGRLNDGIREVADRHGAVLVDTAAVRALQDPRLWAADRLHLTAAGHARVAALALDALGLTATPDLVDAPASSVDDVPNGGSDPWWRQPLPAPDPTTLTRRLAEDGRWFAEHVVPWALRRLRGTSSGDGRAPKRPDATPVLTDGDAPDRGRDTP